jgi:predicted nucleotidyltransferase
MSQALAQLACEVGTSERTLRRGAATALIRAQRSGTTGVVLSASEAAWVRRHWSLVSDLRHVLRTEPNVELAVLFGSVARGEDVAGASDIDLLVGLRRPAAGALAELCERLQRRLAVKVHVVPLDAAQRNPSLLGEVLRDGRPLVDRAQSWARLRTQAGPARARAERYGRELRTEALAALDYFRDLAAARERAPVGIRT